MKSSVCFPLLTAALLAGATPILSAGDVSGKVTLKGTPKPEIDIPLTPECGKINSSKPTTRHFVVSKEGGLGNVFVYIKEAKKTEPKGPPPVLDQIGCMYEPYVFGVVAGQPVQIRSSDAVMHNVRALPKFNSEFNFVELKGQEMTRTFDKPEVMVRIKCDVHPWMFAYVGVCDHPYFAVTDKEGNFKISGLPDGKYTIIAYHLKAHGNKEGITKAIEVKGDTKQDFTVELEP